MRKHNKRPDKRPNGPGRREMRAIQFRRERVYLEGQPSEDPGIRLFTRARRATLLDLGRMIKRFKRGVRRLESLRKELLFKGRILDSNQVAAQVGDLFGALGLVRGEVARRQGGVK